MEFVQQRGSRMQRVIENSWQHNGQRQPGPVWHRDGPTSCGNDLITHDVGNRYFIILGSAVDPVVDALAKAGQGQVAVGTAPSGAVVRRHVVTRIPDSRKPFDSLAAGRRVSLTGDVLKLVR